MTGDPRGGADRWRGHQISETGTGWIYVDSGRFVADDPDRACGHCGLENTPDGYDGCLGKILGAKNACCGHGNSRAAYVQLEGQES